MNTIAKKSVRAGKFLNNQQVASFLGEYKQNRWVANSDKLGKEDALTAWCSVEELETLLEKVKMYGGNGVRICFAAYAENHTEQPELAGRQTVVMVGTRSSKEGGSNKDLYISEGKNAKILAFGDMPICPPLCGDPSGKGFGVTGFASLVDRGDKGLAIV